MACNCSANYDNKVPCCCSQGSPLVCTTTTCEDAQICNQTIESDCVIYTGPSISCSGVISGMTVTEVIDIILEQLNLINCSYCWNVTNDGSLETDFDYVNTDGVNVTHPPITVGSTVQVCGQSVDDTNVTVVEIGRCSVCSYTLIPTRCTGGTGEPGSDDYYQIERTWLESTYTFTLNSMILDGVEYASGQILTINTATDLVTGVSPIDGLTYIMNINDWLNSIAGVATSGFIFYDDMHVIDKPASSSTYTIEIVMVNPSVSYTYYYTSQYGFAIFSPDDILGEYTCQRKPDVETTTTTAVPTTTTTTTAAPTTSTTTIVVVPTTTVIPTGRFVVRNFNESGTIVLLTLGYSPPGFSNGYAISSGSLPLVSGGTILGTHARVSPGLNCSMICSRTGITPGTEGRIKVYVNGVIVLNTLLTTYAGQEGVYFNLPIVAEQTDDLEIIYS